MFGKFPKRTRSNTANFICDRSGGKYRMSEAVKEPGTGLMVHRRFSDGKWNLVEHPLNNLEKYVRFGDPYPIMDARPDRDWAVAYDLTDEYGNLLMTENGEVIQYQ